MAKTIGPGARTAAQKIDKAQRTNDEARATIAAEVAARNKKTARLREQRLAKEESDRQVKEAEAAAKAKEKAAKPRARASKAGSPRS